MVTATRPKPIEIHLLPGQDALLRDSQSSVLAAIAGCVAGDTLIDCPGGQRQIRDLVGFNEVLALTNRGIEAVPAFIFRKAVAQLYRLTLRDGQTIEATADHYLLVSDGQTLHWRSVGDALTMLSGQKEVWVVCVEPVCDGPAQHVGCSLGLRESRPVSCQSSLPSDVRHSSHTVPGYPGRYSRYFRPYGLQPPVVAGNGQEPSPLSGGALGYNHPWWHGDEQDTLQGYIPSCRFSSRLSKNNLIPLPYHVEAGECLPSPCGLGQFQGPAPELSLGHRLTSGSRLPASLDGLFQPVSSSCGVPYRHLQFLLSHTLSKVSSIVPATIASYYDMVVPTWHNYLAQGMVHHNTGGGKTILLYWWLHSRMEAWSGNTWGLAEPTYPMLAKIILTSSDPDRPSLEGYLRQVGHHPDYHAVDHILFTDHGKIYLGSADNPDSMQGAAVRGYALDEPGLMQLAAYQVALQRVSMMKGQVMLASTPYNMGWLKTEVADQAGTKGIHVERWRSIDRPGFPRESYEAMKEKLPPWRFRMLYDATFEHPEGLIYSAFNEADCLVDRFEIPKQWPIYVGHDFGASNPAALFFAIDPATGIKWLWHEYLPGPGLSPHQHIEAWKKIVEGRNVLVRMGGSHQEQGWRDSYIQQGWHIQEPNDVNQVEVQIGKVIGEHQRNRIKVFRDLANYLDEKRTFSRKLGDDSKPTDKIENEAAYHLMAAERYIISYFTPETAGRRGSSIPVSNTTGRPLGRSERWWTTTSSG